MTALHRSKPSRRWPSVDRDRARRFHRNMANCGRDIVRQTSGICDLQRNHLLRQNSSMMSADLRPHRYLPLNRLSRPTHERRPSVAGAINPANSGVLQFKITATRVRPA
jgi:hypothetical protein